jgi:hypothetical protein
MPTARVVNLDGRLIGSVMAVDGAWRAWGGPRGKRAPREFRTCEQAARWVCLQARPVVYQVRRVPHGWHVTAPAGAPECTMANLFAVGRVTSPEHTTQGWAMDCAMALARTHLRRAA